MTFLTHHLILVVTQASWLPPATSTPARSTMLAAAGTGGLVLGTIIASRTACASTVVAPIAVTTLSTAGSPCGVCVLASAFPSWFFKGELPAAYFFKNGEKRDSVLLD